MTDKSLESAILNAQQPVSPVADAQPVVEQPVAPVVNAQTAVIQSSTIQTAENTVFKEKVENLPDSKGQFDDEDNDQTFFHGFIGLNKDNFKKLDEILTMWSSYSVAKTFATLPAAEQKKEQINPSEINAAIANWESYCEEHYPETTLEELDTRFRQLYGFLNSISDTMLVRYPTVSEKGITNASKRNSRADSISSDVKGLTPDIKSGKFDLSVFMRRTALGSSKEAYRYDLLMRNSFLAMAIIKPSRLQQAGLIADIAKAVRGHVRSVSQNVPALANIVVYRVIWKFIVNHIEKASVKDTSDFDELADIIKITDINPLVVSLLAVAHPRGINFSLNCLGDENKCDWHSSEVIDPTSLVRDRSWLDTPEESAMYANSFNFSRAYSREEIIKAQDEVNYQRDIQPVYNKAKNACFILGVPSLSDAFETEAYFESVVKDKIAEIQQTSISEEQYKSRLDDFLNGIVGSDYLHYISEYHVYSDDADTPKRVFKRSDENPEEFNKGILSVITDAPDMGAALINAVITHYPFMTKTFVGMANSTCPKCKAKSAIGEELGYTPINPVMAFFTLTNLTLIGQTKVGEKATLKALSNL